MLHTHFVVPRNKQGGLQPYQTILLSLYHPKQNFDGNVNPSPVPKEMQLDEENRYRKTMELLTRKYEKDKRCCRLTCRNNIESILHQVKKGVILDINTAPKWQNVNLESNFYCNKII